MGLYVLLGKKIIFQSAAGIFWVITRLKDALLLLEFFTCASVRKALRCICSSPLRASDAVEAEEGEEDATLPCTEDVICKTEQITKNIQELLRAAQETKHERYVSLMTNKKRYKCIE